MKETAGLRLIDNKLSAQFEAVTDTDVRGLLAYEKDGDHYDLRHTFVPEELRGLGIAGILVDAVLDQISSEAGTVTPTCSFVKTFIESHPQFQHLVVPNRAQETVTDPGDPGDPAQVAGSGVSARSETTGQEPTNDTKVDVPTAPTPDATSSATTPAAARELHIAPRASSERIDIEPFRILTARLVLRAWDASDLTDALAIYGDPLVARWTTPLLPDAVTEASMRTLLNEWIEESDTSPYPQGRWAIELAENGYVVGGVALTRMSGDDGRLLMSWQIAPDAVGHGLGTEAAHAVAHQAFRVGGADAVFAVMHRTNTRGIGTATRLGMKHTGETNLYFDRTLELFRLDRGEIDLAADRRSLALTD